ncbi:MAG: AAA family ATPase [Butyricicoccus porcorum]|uniref:ATP-binding protein n=1 Tax=Butyricicoccus porcorum TaxID=1945634 RepID=UPI00235643AE|nr:AAA family ATPase [Butyricicoccus porcorum]MDD6987880.1 AAA family ATPase [Butyricicoccus porcorum]MDY4484004.1 AAA family ATPase [Butyricicoccus porcorum]
MNILRAKQEIIHTVRAYLAKDGEGNYCIPSVHQRPVLLMGPPGIGKTAIMEQVAAECGIALVSYTITHHTRQSAIGLPYLTKRNYSGKELTITEYTMSEIIASVYDKMEETDLREGILFIDEINCVSETLAPTMLQLLQRKSFGSHFVPEGWIIVAAGNPPEYNKSVRDFDVVTLDRLRRIDVQEDYAVWKKYAYRSRIHPAILSYLDIKKQNFYAFETTVDGQAFVTARGWEDLSQFLLTCEQLDLPVDEPVILEYLQHPRIARDFAAYYDLFCKYQSDYHVEEILSGGLPAAALERLKTAPFDERLSVIGLLIGRLTEAFSTAYYTDMSASRLFEGLKSVKRYLGQQPLGELLARESDRIRTSLYARQKAAAVDRREVSALLRAAQQLEDDRAVLSAEAVRSDDDGFVLLSERFQAEVQKMEEQADSASQQLEHAFAFLETAFGKSQELVVFVTELNTNFFSTWFIGQYGSEAYARNNKELMIGKRRQQLLGDIGKIQSFLTGL